jgi:hypothetical protein
VRKTQQDNYRFSALVMNIVESPAFRMNSIPKPQEKKPPVHTASN